MPKVSRQLILFCAAFYLLLVGLVLGSILRKTGGHFLYALDDPYIHLALAENLAHGHYGINPTEFTSPSSSILWPFLLLPFAGTAFHVYVPLVWNLLFGTVTACLIGVAVGRWPPQADEQGGMPRWQQVVTAMLLIFAANLISLTVMGMEHVLQVLLAVCCAFGMAEVLSGRPLPRWTIAAAILAPMVRYEDFTLTLAICIVMAGLRQWKRAIGVFGLSLVPVVSFSAFLHQKGLPLLPMSVLIKGGGFHDVRPVVQAYRLIHDNFNRAFTEAERFPVLVLFFLFAGLAWYASTRVQRFVFVAAAAVGALQLAIGRFGWFHRYEVYAVVFLALLLMRVLSERPRFLFGAFALGLVFCAAPYIEATAQSSTASLEIYEQQYQMHRFVKDFYQGDYAVNDLGLVSFARRPGAYVLDVYGLASLDASRHPDKSAAWMEAVVQRYHVPLAILYPEWFHIPPTWTALGRLCSQQQDPIVLYDKCVVFYSTSPERVEDLRSSLQQFAATLPKGDEFSLARPLIGFDPAPK